MIDQSTILRAKKLSPASLWIKWGFEIKYAGDEIRVYAPGEPGCLYRSALQADGTWLSGMADAGVAIAPGVGDNPSLVRHFTRKRVEKSFEDCVSYILYICRNDPPANRRSVPAASRTDRLVLPAQSQKGDDMGRLYLSARGISREVADLAEKAGVIRFSAGNADYAASVLFLGFRRGEPAYAAKRCAEPLKEKDTSDKRDLAGSDKTWIPIYEGDPDIAIIVEGGVNLLSVMELFHRAGREIPTVVMTGGGGNLKWKDNAHLEEVLGKAKQVWLFGENDVHLSRIKREAAGKAKEAQRREASDLSGREVVILYPPRGCNDINDVVTAGKMTEEMREILRILTPDQAQAPRA